AKVPQRRSKPRRPKSPGLFVCRRQTDHRRRIGDNMYIPEPFKEQRIDVLHDAIGRAGLATLVTLAADGLIASHVPLLLDPLPAPYWTLLGHLARPNPQAHGAVGDALAIFLGPDAYITPSWYATKRETGKVVPTWNYVAIHAY